MGTPKQSGQFCFPALEAPSIAQKIRLLASAKSYGVIFGGGSNLREKLMEIMEVLLPLARELDKPIFAKDGEFGWLNPPEPFRKTRGMRLFSTNFLGIWLTRYGRWFVYFRIGPSREDQAYQEVDSGRLAEIIAQKSLELMSRSNRRVVNVNDLSLGLFAEGAEDYQGVVLRLFNEFYRRAQELIEERAAKLRLMEERVNFFGDYVEALDPLRGREKRLTLKTYALFCRSKRGSSRRSADYFCPEALAKMKEIVVQRQLDPADYEDFISERGFESLESFIAFFADVFSQIDAGRACGTKGPEAIFDLYSNARVPFLPEERKVLEELLGALMSA